jgi:hypothetical protein
LSTCGGQHERGSKSGHGGSYLHHGFPKNKFHR